MTLFKLHLALPALLFIAACAQPEPVPEPIYPQPVYDKWGNDIGAGGGGCSGGKTAGASSNCIPQTGQGRYKQPAVTEKVGTTGHLPPLTKTVEGGGDGSGAAQ